MKATMGQIKIKCNCEPFQVCEICADPQTSENEIEKQIIEYLERLPRCKVTKTSTTGRHKGNKWIKAKDSERKGKADLTICYLGRYIEIEVKRPGGKQKPEQKLQELETIAAGGVYWLVYSLDDVIKNMEKL